MKAYDSLLIRLEEERASLRDYYCSSLQDVTEDFESARKKNSLHKEGKEIIKKLSEVSILVLKEIGNGDNLFLQKSLLSSILKNRIRNNKKTILFSSLSKKDFLLFIGKDNRRIMHNSWCPVYITESIGEK